MRAKYFNSMLATAISAVLMATPSYAYQSSDTPGGVADVALMNTSELRALVAPIALYPDPLVAQILSAASGGTPNGVKDFLVNGKMTGGFTILAYPAEYRNSGIMSFLIGQDGRLYQKDLGEKTAEVAANMTQANPADGWTSIQTQTNTASRMQ
jgi:hypothetical protein